MVLYELKEFIKEHREQPNVTETKDQAAGQGETGVTWSGLLYRLLSPACSGELHLVRWCGSTNQLPARQNHQKQHHNTRQPYGRHNMDTITLVNMDTMTSVDMDTMTSVDMDTISKLNVCVLF